MTPHAPRHSTARTADSKRSVFLKLDDLRMMPRMTDGHHAALSQMVMAL